MALIPFTFLAATTLLGPAAAPVVPVVDYARQVKPVLTARCYACHGALQQKGGLRLDTAALLRQGGDRGPAIVPGKSDESLLLDHLLGANGSRRMPPPSDGEALKADEIALVRAWIDQGAVAPAGEKPEADPKDHWAFKAPRRPALPRQAGGAAGNPIDAFLAAAHARHGLKPQGPADRRLLLRRVSLDLTGLPPTPQEQASFLADTAPAAYERAVDRLLASQHHGERWGRHWMDVWRYSDWWGLGAEVRNSQKHMWHWRDWIIESLNADKGYDQMVREMLAADELYPTDADRLRATGYLARSYFKFNRNSWLEEVVEHTSKAFLGLTMNCSKCHDHKYDPLSQTDFYRFRALFEPYQVRTDMVPGEADFERNGVPRVFDCNLDRPTYLFIRGDEKQPRTDRPVSPGLPKLLAGNGLDIRPVTLPAEAYQPGLKAHVLEAHLRRAEATISAARTALDRARHALAAAQAAPKPPAAKPNAQPPVEQARLALVTAEKALAAARLEPEALRTAFAADRAKHAVPPAADAKDLARQATLAERRLALARAEEALARADQQPAAAARRAALLKEVEAKRKALDAPGEGYTSLRGSLKTLESNVESEASRSRPFPATSTGRRSALARWLTTRGNPLTARVAVNHVWARHFGKPLVATVFDFGRKGAAPTHPELLDWLAVEFEESGWSLKHLHRLIVTSQAYRRSSSARGAAEVNLKNDPENRLYWRMNPLRMEAQVVRDSLLHLSGDLDPTLGGPSVPVANEASRRRSLYYVHSHNEHNRFLSIFDDANVLECYRRAESVVPQQALALQNSRLARTAAEKIAARLEVPTLSDPAFLRTAFELVLGSSPGAAEQAACEQALAELQALAGREKVPEPRRRARVTLIHALLNHNDFVTIR